MSQEMVYSYITHSNRFLSEDDFLEELFMYMTMPTKTATFLGLYVLLTLIPHKNGCSFFRKWKFSKCFLRKIGLNVTPNCFSIICVFYREYSLNYIIVICAVSKPIITKYEY